MCKTTISIVIPVYDAESYLNKCLDSILSQTFRDFELILIDDGCLDKSGVICDKYALIDRRTRVFHTPNHGRSYARNLGIKESNGKYITFCDADDWVDSTWLDSMVMGIGDTDFICEGSYHHNKDETTKEVHQFGRYTKSEYNPICAELVKDRYVNNIWKCLYKRDIILKYNIYFNESIICGEDLDFNLRYLFKTENMIISDECHYHYNYNSDKYKIEVKELNIILQSYKRLVSDPYWYILQEKYVSYALCSLLEYRCDIPKIKEVKYFTLENSSLYKGRRASLIWLIINNLSAKKANKLLSFLIKLIHVF